MKPQGYEVANKRTLSLDTERNNETTIRSMFCNHDNDDVGFDLVGAAIRHN